MRFVMLCALALMSATACAASPPLARLKLPPGFHVSVYSDQVPSAREIALGAKGTVFVGSMGAGKVYALTDSDHDGHADKVRVLTGSLQGQQAWGRPVDVQPMPDGSLLVSDDQNGAIYRVTYMGNGE